MSGRESANPVRDYSEMYPAIEDEMQLDVYQNNPAFVLALQQLVRWLSETVPTAANLAHVQGLVSDVQNKYYAEIAASTGYSSDWNGTVQNLLMAYNNNAQALSTAWPAAYAFGLNSPDDSLFSSYLTVQQIPASFYDLYTPIEIPDEIESESYEWVLLKRVDNLLAHLYGTIPTLENKVRYMRWFEEIESAYGEVLPAGDLQAVRNAVDNFRMRADRLADIPWPGLEALGESSPAAYTADSDPDVIDVTDTTDATDKTALYIGGGIVAALALYFFAR